MLWVELKIYNSIRDQSYLCTINSFYSNSILLKWKIIIKKDTQTENKGPNSILSHLHLFLIKTRWLDQTLAVNINSHLLHTSSLANFCFRITVLAFNDLFIRIFWICIRLQSIRVWFRLFLILTWFRVFNFQVFFYFSRMKSSQSGLNICFQVSWWWIRELRNVFLPFVLFIAFE